MRVLILTGQLPYPPQAGGALRTLGLLDGLHRAGHQIDLLTFVDPEQPDPSSTPLATICQQIVTVPLPSRSMRQRLRDIILTSHPDMTQRFFSTQYIAALQALLATNRYDLVQMESLEMTIYLPTIRQYNTAARVIYDSFNAEFDLQRLIYTIDRNDLRRLPGAVYSFIQWRRLTRYEKHICRQVDYVIAVSEADAAAFRKLAPGAKVGVVPNGIYVDQYTATEQGLELGPSALLFTGTMNYRPNVDAILWFADEILEQIRTAVPDVRLFVVGNKPSGRLDSIRQHPNVEITGYVQDVLPFLRSAAVYVAPLRMGSGTRLKLLQAMAAGCAIVSTSIGAQGLNVTSGEHLLLAENVSNFAQATITLLKNPEQRQKLGQAAQKLVCEQYDWTSIVPRLLAIYRELGLG